MKDLLWLIPLFPLLGAVVNGLCGNRRGWKHRTTAAVSLIGSGLAMCAAFAAIIDWTTSLGTHAVHANRVFTWIPLGPGLTADGLLANLTIDFTLRLDALSAVMLFVVTFVGFVIHVYSVGYMHSESARSYARYFAYLNLFMFAMLTLVLGANLGEACIGGDPGPYAAAATPIALLLFVGAIGKSAQLPLYVWLPDAMAGPTPVSALIHAATMVTAGVYLVVRCHVLFQLAPFTMGLVAIIGAVTALYTASIGMVQNDIKRVLAYSTISQLGYMFLGCGVGAFASGIFHLMTHAFFKALLFLGAGSVMHALSGEQDLR